MSVSPTLREHLTALEADYQVLSHPQTFSTNQTAQVSHIPGGQVAKAVVMKDDEGFMLAVLPAVHHIWFKDLNELTHRNLSMASEEEASQLFADCEMGAFPVMGEAFGLDVVLDDSLNEQPDVYFEGGDHASLLRMSGGQFQRMMENAIHGRFSYHD